MPPAYDIVVVPDFAGANARLFELRTLFFLASWLENAGDGRNLPLHVACIGEPPASVRALATQCGASITMHEPLTVASSPTANKLRGLEIEGRTDHVLLLDADIVVLGEISSMLSLGEGIAAAPDLRPRVPARYWPRIYKALDIDEPTERFVSVIGEYLDPGLMGQRSNKQNQRMLSMYPYHHGAVVYAPWRSDLRNLWELHIRRIAAMFTPDDPHWRDLGRSDQAGLTIAIELMRRAGLPFDRLPASMDANWPHLVSGTLGWGEVHLLHAANIFRPSSALTEDDPSIESLIEDYCATLTNDRLDRRHRFDKVIKHDVPRFTDFMTRLETELNRLHELHIAPLLNL